MLLRSHYPGMMFNLITKVKRTHCSPQVFLLWSLQSCTDNLKFFFPIDASINTLWKNIPHVLHFQNTFSVAFICHLQFGCKVSSVGSAVFQHFLGLFSHFSDNCCPLTTQLTHPCPLPASDLIYSGPMPCWPFCGISFLEYTLPFQTTYPSLSLTFFL